MPVKEFNPQYVSDKKSKDKGLAWANKIHADLVKSGKRSESEELEEPDIVQEVKEVIKEVAEKTTEE